MKSWKMTARENYRTWTPIGFRYIHPLTKRWCTQREVMEVINGREKQVRKK